MGCCRAWGGGRGQALIFWPMAFWRVEKERFKTRRARQRLQKQVGAALFFPLRTALFVANFMARSFVRSLSLFPPFPCSSQFQQVTKSGAKTAQIPPTIIFGAEEKHSRRRRGGAFDEMGGFRGRGTSSTGTQTSQPQQSRQWVGRFFTPGTLFKEDEKASINSRGYCSLG